MADEKEDISKKCAETGTSLKRTKRYYREGRYFLNKNAYQTWKKKEDAKKAEAKSAEESAAPAAG